MIDVVVVGAGPAGLAAAVTIARSGARVLVVERAPAGAAAPADAVAVLNTPSLDLLATLDARLAAGPIAAWPAWRLSWPIGPPVRVAAPATVVAFEALLTALRDAASRSGVRFEWGWHVRRALIDDASGAVRGLALARRDRRSLRIPAPIVVAADGRRSRLAHRRFATLRGAGGWCVVEGRLSGVALDELGCGEMHVGRRAYLEMVPAGHNGAWVRFVHTDAAVRGAAAIVEVTRRAFPRLARRLSGAHVVGRPCAWRVGPDEVRSVPPGVLLAGHASGRLDPRSANDLGDALVGGWRVGATVVRFMETGDVTGSGVEAGAFAPGASSRPDPTRRCWSILARPSAAVAFGAVRAIAPRWSARAWGGGGR